MWFFKTHATPHQKGGVSKVPYHRMPYHRRWNTTGPSHIREKCNEIMRKVQSGSMEGKALSVVLQTVEKWTSPVVSQARVYVCSGMAGQNARHLLFFGRSLCRSSTSPPAKSCNECCQVPCAPPQPDIQNPHTVTSLSDTRLRPTQAEGLWSVKRPSQLLQWSWTRRAIFFFKMKVARKYIINSWFHVTVSWGCPPTFPIHVLICLCSSGRCQAVHPNWNCSTFWRRPEKCEDLAAPPLALDKQGLSSILISP